MDQNVNSQLVKNVIIGTEYLVYLIQIAYYATLQQETILLKPVVKKRQNAVTLKHLVVTLRQNVATTKQSVVMRRQIVVKQKLSN